MSISEFLAIGIVGAAMSVVFEIINSRYASNPNKTKFLVILLSLIVGALYVWVRTTPYFVTVVTILGAASTVYALFFNKKSS